MQNGQHCEDYFHSSSNNNVDGDDVDIAKVDAGEFSRQFKRVRTIGSIQQQQQQEEQHETATATGCNVLYICEYSAAA